MSASLQDRNGQSTRLKAGSDPVKVMKFGGTSVGMPERLRTVARVVAEASRAHRVIVVVSAASGVTDRLVECLRLDSWEETDAFLRDRYTGLAAEVLSDEARVAYEAVLVERLDRLGRLFNLRHLLGACPKQDAEILAAGERLMAPLLAALLTDSGTPARAADAADLLRTSEHYTEATVLLEPTIALVRAWFDAWPRDVVPVVTGFIGSTGRGHTSVLGRGGSDYSAAVLARALEARVFERWTDIDGLYTADPRLDPNARRLASIAYEDALPFMRSGRLGMHVRALEPLLETHTEVHVRSTLLPESPGTRIRASIEPR